LITKGKTERSLNKYSLPNEIIGTYTNNGWVNENCIIMILKQISIFTKNEKSVLLMDQYGSHMMDNVKAYAISKNINIIYVPVGMTYKYQPLDVLINGISKNKARKSYSEFIAKNKNKSYTHAQCITDFLKNKKEITKKTIIKSFDCLKKHRKIIIERNISKLLKIE